MCNGFWDACNCDDCNEVKGLYEELEWFEQDRESNKDIINELENKIEDMGYFI